MSMEIAWPTEAPLVPTNFGDRAELGVAALTALGCRFDRDEILDQARATFGQYAAAGLGGETYIQPPAFNSNFTPQKGLEVVDGIVYPDGRKYPQTYPLTESEDNISRRLWFPKDSTREGYSRAEINRLTVVGEGEDEPVIPGPHARIALTDGPRSEEPLLHLLGLPYDEVYAEEGQPTQLTELERMKCEFNAQHPELALDAINLAGFTMIALQRRIEGKGKPMPMNWGFMRIPQLGRKTVDGDSVVGGVSSVGTQLNLGWSYGLAYSGDGVGLSGGPKKLKS